MGFSGTERVKIVHGDAGHVLEDDVRHLSDSNPDLPSFSMGAPNANKKITSRRDMGSRRSRAISPRFSFNRFLLALVILSDVIMVAHCKQSCGLEHCKGRATKACCDDMDLCISTESCGALCGKCNSYNRIDNGLIRKCFDDWKCGACGACECK